MKNKYFLIVFILLLAIACKKDDDKNNVCHCPPCFSNTNDYGNKVAHIPQFRQGKWVNTSPTAFSPDTIVFHNDSIWSNYNAFDGTFENKYQFMDYDLIIYNDFSGNPLENSWSFPTRFNDSTCILHIRRIPNATYDEWDKYIRVE